MTLTNACAPTAGKVKDNVLTNGVTTGRFAAPVTVRFCVIPQGEIVDHDLGAPHTDEKEKRHES